MNSISATSNTKNGMPAGNAVLWVVENSNATGKAPTYSQNYNRYSYAWNNPLKFFDPSGYINQYPDEGGIPTRHRDGGSTSATFAPGSMVNVWNGRGGFGPGSGRHWSDPYRGVWGNFMLGSRSSFISIYGKNAHENYVSYYTGDNNRFVWNPVAGDEVYRESGKGYVNIYYSGGWVKASPFTGPAFGGGVPVYSNALIDGPGGSDGGGDMPVHFNASEKVALGLAATSGAVNLTTGLIDKLSGAVKNTDVVNFGKSVTKKFGLVGVGMTTYNSFSDDAFTVGDGARILMSGVTFIPYAGWIYGAFDMGVLLTTGTSATDRIGNYIDVHWGPGPIRP